MTTHTTSFKFIRGMGAMKRKQRDEPKKSFLHSEFEWVQGPMLKSDRFSLVYLAIGDNGEGVGELGVSLTVGFIIFYIFLINS